MKQDKQVDDKCYLDYFYDLGKQPAEGEVIMLWKLITYILHAWGEHSTIMEYKKKVEELKNERQKIRDGLNPSTDSSTDVRIRLSNNAFERKTTKIKLANTLLHCDRDEDID